MLLKIGELVGHVIEWLSGQDWWIVVLIVLGAIVVGGVGLVWWAGREEAKKTG